MIRMRIFKVDFMKFDLVELDEDLKRRGEKGAAQYNIKMKRQEDEVAPIENFIYEIGFENIRSITTATGSSNYLACTIFYEDNGIRHR